MFILKKLYDVESLMFKNALLQTDNLVIEYI